MDDVDLAAADDVFVIVVDGVDVRPQPAQMERDLARGQRSVIDLPDREVGVASTRSSTAGSDQARIDAEHERDDSEGEDTLARHRLRA